MLYVNKTCRVCNQLKEHTPRGKSCRDCKTEYDKRYFEANKDRLNEIGLKYRGINYNKERKKKYDAAYRLENKDRIIGDKIRKKISGDSHKINRKSHLKNTYGLAIEEYEEMYQKQNGACKICKIIELTGKGKYLCVDHCHSTGEIRGLLCGRCNAGLGNFKDNIVSLANAIEYLNKQ